MINLQNNKIESVYQNLRSVIDDFPNFKKKTLRLASNPNNKSNHKAYGYLWYRFVDIPNEILKANGL